MPPRPLRVLRAHPTAAAVCLLALSAVVFLSLSSSLGDGVFIICNLLPLVFGAFYGMRWGVAFAVVHTLFALALAEAIGLEFVRFVSHGIPATAATIVLSGATGRIRDLTASLRHELEERRRYERELQQHRARLESLVEARTNELQRSNEELRREIAEHERTEAEKRQLEASLKRAEKMEAVGLLAGSVAHDLNNSLTSVVAYPELILAELPDDSPLRPALLAIESSGQRAAAIVDDLLTMARGTITSREVLDLNAVVSELISSPEFVDLTGEHPDVRIYTILDPALLAVLGSPLHLSRSVTNLVRNAIEALPNGGNIVVSTGNVSLQATAARYEPVSEGEYVTLSVGDDGVGIAPADLDHIFEPFYTKKRMGRSGTGLGMAIVWGTVKDHGGFVDVRSEPGQGTTVTVFLPATRARKPSGPVAPKLDLRPGRGESILVVDDLPVQRDLCAAILQKLGYSVSCAASGEAAVEHVRRCPVDLVVLDMIMEPGIDGLDTYRRILEIRPGQKAIIASGYSETERVRQALELGAGAYVRKPYTLEKLASAVSAELQKPLPS